MSEAQLIIGEAKKTIDTSDTGAVKKAEAPKADFKATEAPKASLSDLSSASPASVASNAKTDSFSGLGSNSFNRSNNNVSKPAQAPQQEQPKPQPQPAKKNNFSFDMAELLKAAEEEAAKNPES